jgi:hypothetical protein
MIFYQHRTAIEYGFEDGKPISLKTGISDPRRHSKRRVVEVVGKFPHFGKKLWSPSFRIVFARCAF